jgi:hemerythrin
MEYVWDKSIEVGNEMIDTQHKRLFDAINDLLEKCKAGKGTGELGKSMDFLNDYTIKHFFDEEQIQKKYNYPDQGNHKNYHDEFKKTVRELKVKLIMKGPSEELLNEFREKIGGWLVSHIKVQDARLAAHIKAGGD